MGAMFDRDQEGRLLLAREGGHSLARIVHAGGAATGAEIERALVDAVREPTAAAPRSAGSRSTSSSRTGVPRRASPSTPDGERQRDPGPPRRCWRPGARVRCSRSRPTRSRPPVTASPWRCGPACRSPTSSSCSSTRRRCSSPRMPRPLLSEALRGHGALIRDPDGERFVDELRPRDVVSRAITAKLLEQGTDHVCLDATGPRGLRRALPDDRRRPARRRPRPGTRLAADRTRRALPLRRRGDRPRRGHLAAGPLGRRRGRLHGRARRQPPGLQLAARGHGVRAAGDRGHRAGRRRCRAHRRHAGGDAGRGAVG